MALGQLHFYGARGVTRDTGQAAEYFRAAAESGEPAAKSHLGQMYAQGIGVPKNNATAFRLFKEAADQVGRCPPHFLSFSLFEC